LFKKKGIIIKKDNKYRNIIISNYIYINIRTIIIDFIKTIIIIEIRKD